MVFSRKPQKCDNHPASRANKVALREAVFKWIAPEKCIVFDAFAGQGEMHRLVWHRAAKYVGCDLKWYPDDREAFVADNSRVLRTVDLAPFNVIDLDSYGCPYEQAIIVAARRELAKGEIIAFCLTDGSGLRLKMGGVPKAIRELTGLAAKIECANRSHHEITAMCLRALATRIGARLVDRWEAVGKTGAQVLYTTAIFAGGAA